MKLFNKIVKLILITLFFVVQTTLTGSSNKKWCWTKNMSNDPSFSLNARHGGMNWGYCKKSSSLTSSYYITLFTSSLPSSGTNSKLLLQLRGTKGQTAMKEISSNTQLETGSEYEVSFQANNIGTITKAILKLEGTIGYRCKRMEIKKDNEIVSFDCLKRLEPCDSISSFKCQMEMVKEGDIPYEITVRAGEEKNSGINSPILFGIIGTKGKSNLSVLSETGIESGKTKTETKNYEDVDSITGYQMSISEKGTFTYTYVMIKNIISGEIKEFDMGTTTLSNPGRDTIVFDENNRSDGNEAGSASSKQGGLNFILDMANKALSKEDDVDDDDDENETTQEKDNHSSSNISQGPNQKQNFGFLSKGDGSKDGFNINDPYGGVMSMNEKSKIIQLSCTQALVNPSQTNMLFGPNFVNGKGNYMNFLARCPGDCHKIQGVVTGSGIHPNTSPICLSAIVDNAISFYGGIISISVFPGLESYTVNEKNNQNFPNIEIQTSQVKAEKSYTLAKVDNVDLVEKDIRILNEKGELTNEGRVEFRINGIWGSICSIGNNDESAIRICKDLGYKNGKWLNDGSEFCRNFNGGDYCGAEGTRVHFSNIQCISSDMSINTCNKQYAKVNECPKSLDAIISCNNINTLEKESIPNGVVKLEDVNMGDDYVTGRVEMSQNNEFYPICSNGMKGSVPDVICKQMGYISGVEITEDEVAKEFKLDNEDPRKFSASNVQCSGKESKLTKCKVNYISISCSHSQDLVIKCKGNEGDYTGTSQYSEEQKIPFPGLGKLGLPKFQVSCDTTGEFSRLRGDIGSLFLIKCPKECVKISSPVIGTGLFRKDSSICRAAIHAGIITNKKGGLIGLVKLPGVETYIGTSKNGVITSNSQISLGMSFSLFQVNSGWKGMWKIITKNMGGSYIEKAFNTGYYMSPYVSFLETSYEPTNYPAPFFKWVEDDSSHFFSDLPDSAYLLPSKNKKAISTFTIALKVSISSLESTKYFLYSTNSCGGFNIYIDDDTLFIGDPCNSKRRVQTDLVIGINDSTLIYITFNNNELKIILSPESYSSPIIKIFDNVILRIDPSEVIGIGRATETSKYNFNGKIQFIGVFDTILDLNKVKLFIQDVEEMKYNEPKDEEEAELTKDGRECVSKCLTGLTPEEDNSLLPPVLADPSNCQSEENSNGKESEEEDNEESFNAGGDENGNKNNNGNWKSNNGNSNNDGSNGSDKGEVSSFSNSSPSEVSPLPIDENSDDEVSSGHSQSLSSISIEVECDTTLESPKITQKISKSNKIHVKCPSTCLKSPKPAYGTGNYHLKSSICTAAYHTGITSEYVSVTIIKGFNAYNGSFGKNNIETQSMGPGTKSFTVAAAQAPKIISCIDTVDTVSSIKKEIGQKTLLSCPKNCKSTLQIYGTDIYTDNSPICIAAIHNGVISFSEGGEVEIEIKPPQSSFKGSQGVGLLSHNYSNKKNCFGFVGSKFEGATNYQETFEGSIESHWEFIQKIKKENDFWKFEDIKINHYSSNYPRSAKAIHHSGDGYNKIREESTSFLLLKNSDLSRGAFRAQFKYEKSTRPFSFVIGYESDSSYFNLIIDPAGESSNIKLIKTTHSGNSILQEKYLTIQEGKWYSTNIIVEKNKIMVDIHPGDSHEQKVVIDVEISEILHGKVGFGANGNSNLYLGDISLSSEIRSHKKSFGDEIRNKRTWFEKLKDINKKSFNKYCSQFRNNKEKEECKDGNMFCRDECSSIINPNTEKVLHYSCYKDCKKKINALTAKNR